MFYPGLVQLAILTIFFGFFNGMMNLSINAIFAEAVPNEIRGRAYSATNAYLQIFTALFTGLSGVTASIFGLVNTFVGVSLIFITFVLVFSLITRYRFLRD
jgi:MFS family permease